MKKTLSLVLCSTFSLLLASATAADAVPRRRLELPPGPGNPRNSEGDFVQLKDGRILFVYTRFNGKDGGDNSAAELAARWSSDRGETWTKEDRIVVKNNGAMNVMSVSLMRLDNGRIAMFYLLKNSDFDCLPVVRFSDDEGETWSEAVYCLKEPVGYYVLNNDRAIQLKNGPRKGRIILPLARHSFLNDKDFDGMGTILCVYSDDNGLTWSISTSKFKVYTEAGQRLVAQEPGVIELKDGRVLMFIRASGGYQRYTYSFDGGDTWTIPVQSPLCSPVSPATMERLPNGDIVGIWNNRDGVPSEVRDRVPLTVAISKDEGTTWQYVKNLESCTQGWYCYIAAEVVDDAVLLGYCCDGLDRTRITKVPIKWLYTEAADKTIRMVEGIFDGCKEGPFTRLETKVGVWTAAEGHAEVFKYERGTGVHVMGGENKSVELELAAPMKLKDLEWLGIERFASAPPYVMTIEALQGDKWVKVASQGGDADVKIKYVQKFTDPDMTVSRLRFTCTGSKGAIVGDRRQTGLILPGFFKNMWD